MLDELKRQGEVGIALEYILEKKQVSSISLKKKDNNCRFLENKEGFIILSLGDFDPATGGGG